MIIGIGVSLFITQLPVIPEPVQEAGFISSIIIPTIAIIASGFANQVVYENPEHGCNCSDAVHRDYCTTEGWSSNG